MRPRRCARKYPAISKETVSTGMLSSSPAIPDDDVDTIGLPCLLVAQSRMPTTTARASLRASSTRIEAEARAERTASPPEIEPAETDKDALHHRPSRRRRTPIDDDTGSFMDPPSDMMHLGAAALGIIGSIFAAIYTKITRVAPRRASELAGAILGTRRAGRPCHLRRGHLDELQDEPRRSCRRAVVGLRDGSVSSDELDTFQGSATSWSATRSH